MANHNPYADPVQTRERVYVAGPYTGDTIEEQSRNVCNAERASLEVMRLGHYAFCPHTMTSGWEQVYEYEAFMELDQTFLLHWATCVLVVGDSPGTAREVAAAHELGIPVHYDTAALVRPPEMGNSSPRSA